MFKLTVDREVQSASIWVRWCLDKETRDYLEREVSGAVRLLLIITGGSPWKETRMLVPLDNVLQILPARYPGKNTILSAIVWGSTIRYLKEAYLGRPGRFYNFFGVSYPEKDEKDGVPRINSPCLNGPVIEVDVPEEAFAPEPPAWERKWVNLWFKHAPVDQCEYRKRRIIAYTLQPIIFSLVAGVTGIITLLLTLVFLVGGFYRYSFNGFGANILRAFGVYGSREDNYWYLLWHKIFPEDAEAQRRREEEKARREKQEEEERKEALRHLYESLVCDHGNEKSPPVRQRIHLFYHGVKDKVCKPFAG